MAFGLGVEWSARPWPPKLYREPESPSTSPPPARPWTAIPFGCHRPSVSCGPPLAPGVTLPNALRTGQNPGLESGYPSVIATMCSLHALAPRVTLPPSHHDTLPLQKPALDADG